MKTIFGYIICSLAGLVSCAVIFTSIAQPVQGNYPNTSIPLSTNTTVTPDAAPTNTTNINVSTSTNFKGTLAGDPTTGVVRVTDAHPAGTYNVTVTAFDNVGATATKTFTLTVTTPSTCNPVRFGAPAYINSGSGTGPYSVTLGDFNGDGKQDIAVVNVLGSSVAIFLGDGAGSFSSGGTFAAGSFPYAAAVADFNGDGKQDLAVASHHSNSVAILLGDGTGNFSSPTIFPAGTFPTSIAVGDFNGDGNQDLAVTNELGGGSILLGNGAGNFSAATNFGAGSRCNSIAVGDFNGDGKLDLATANEGSANISILLGDGVGGFGPATNVVVGTAPVSVVVGDFNADGKQDLAVANLNSSSVSILLGDGAGGFSAAVDVAIGTTPQAVAVGDFNGDQMQDLAVANYDSGNISILLGDGTGNFGAAPSFPVGTNPYSLAVGDFNGDGQQDLAVVNYADSTLSILLRDCSTTLPSPSPTPAPPPGAVTIDFEEAPSDDANYGPSYLTPQGFLFRNFRNSTIPVDIRIWKPSNYYPGAVTTKGLVNSYAFGTTTMTEGMGAVFSVFSFNLASSYPRAVTFTGTKVDNSTVSQTVYTPGNGYQYTTARLFGFDNLVSFDWGQHSNHIDNIVAVVEAQPTPTPTSTPTPEPSPTPTPTPTPTPAHAYSAQVQSPINADGTSVFTVRRGVVPGKFTLTDFGSPTCTLPPATIVVTRTAGGTTGEINESVYSMSADSGSNFRIDSCQYVYNLNSSALGVGTYRVDIKIDGQVVGSGIFQLK